MDGQNEFKTPVWVGWRGELSIFRCCAKRNKRKTGVCTYYLLFVSNRVSNNNNNALDERRNEKNRRRCFIGGYNVRGREGEKSRPPNELEVPKMSARK